MKTILFVLLSSFLLTGFTQTVIQDKDDKRKKMRQQMREKMREQFRQERRQMMQQMMKMFNDDFSHGDAFGDDVDPFSGFGQMRSAGGQNVEIQEEFQKNGDIHIKVIPKKSNVELDIQTTDRMITIKSETKVEEETKEGDQSFKSFSSSSFQQSIGIPQGYKVKSSKQIKKGWLFVLSQIGKMKKYKPRNSKPRIKPSPSDRVPVDKQEGEEII